MKFQTRISWIRILRYSACCLGMIAHLHFAYAQSAGTPSLEKAAKANKQQASQPSPNSSGKGKSSNDTQVLSSESGKVPALIGEAIKRENAKRAASRSVVSTTPSPHQAFVRYRTLCSRKPSALCNKLWEQRALWLKD